MKYLYCKRCGEKVERMEYAVRNGYCRFCEHFFVVNEEIKKIIYGDRR